jgi:hypothetical protein
LQLQVRGGEAADCHEQLVGVGRDVVTCLHFTGAGVEQVLQLPEQLESRFGTDRGLFPDIVIGGFRQR